MEIINRACPICNSTTMTSIFAVENFNESALNDFAFASRKVPEYMHYQLNYCSACDVIYASPVPTSGWFINEYEKADYDSMEEANYAAETYASILRSLISVLPNQEGALDIGTGNGAFLEKLINLGFTKVEGIEPSISPINAASANIRGLIRQAVFKASDYKKDSFSLVSCFQTLEHLYEPLGLMKEVYQVLKPGGATFIIFHNLRSFSAKMLGLKSPIYDIEHLQLFSFKSMQKLMQESGFVDVKIRMVHNRYPLNYWVKLFPMSISLKRRLLAALTSTGLGKVPIIISAGNLAAIGFKK